MRESYPGCGREEERQENEPGGRSLNGQGETLLSPDSLWGGWEMTSEAGGGTSRDPELDVKREQFDGSQLLALDVDSCQKRFRCTC